MKEHAAISNTGNEIEIRPASPGAKIKVNGSPITGAQILMHKDRILFGMFVLIKYIKFNIVFVIHHL